MEQTIAKIGFAEIIQETQRFINKHLLAVGALSLTAAAGRYIQEGGAGRISAEAFFMPEIAVELSRIVLVLLVIGNGAVAVGFRRLLSVFSLKRADWKQVWYRIRTNVAWNRIALSVNFILFMIIGTVVNMGIDLLTHLFLLEWLKSQGLLAAAAYQWPVILFLKNVSIIPFTLVFQCVLVLFLIGKVKLQ